MASISNRLCNPTPFDVQWPYDKGVKIPIKAYGFTDLDVSVMDDFRSGKPGSAAVQELMNHFGIFLRNPDLSYETQALNAIEASIKDKKSAYDGFVSTLRKNRASQGISENEVAFEEMIVNSGYGEIRKQIEKLKEHAKFLKELVAKQNAESQERGFDFNPKTTLMFTDPPRQFDNEVALQMFLMEHPALKVQHDEWLEANGFNG
jgi:hypothetical protein